MRCAPLHRGVTAVCGLVIAATAAGCGAEPSSEVAVREFLLNWQEGDHAAAAARTTGDRDAVAGALEDFSNHLDLASLRLEMEYIQRDGDAAEAGFHATADLGIGDPVWDFDGEMTLQRSDGRWLVEWSSAVMHPQLDEGERLAVTYDAPERGQIVGRDDEPLVQAVPVIAFGVRPGEMTEIGEGIDALAELLETDAAPMRNRVRSAPPGEFQPLVLRRDADTGDRLVRRAERIEGVETSEVTMPLTPDVAAGVVGEAAGTDEHNIANRVAGTYQAGDTVGLGGLQTAYQSRLAGTATTRLVTLDSSGQEVDEVATWGGDQSQSLSTSIDTRVQQAAEASLGTAVAADAVRRGSMVAVDARTGDILAAADSPSRMDSDLALSGEYLPGNTWSIVTSAALLGSGISPTDPVGCELERNVGERTFQNRSGPALWGQPDLLSVFANSCTTGFVDMVDDLEPSLLEETAADFGFGAEWELPVAANNGALEVGDSPADAAALAVGEDGTTVSPLTMALVAGAVADGTWHSPVLVPGETRDQVRAPDVPLDPGVVEPLRELMRATVLQGGATAANVGLQPVYGQVAVVPQTIDGERRYVQWFVGYQGDVAFAAAVEVNEQYASLAVNGNSQYAVLSIAELLYRLPEDYTTPTDAQAQGGAEPSPDAGTD